MKIAKQISKNRILVQFSFDKKSEFYEIKDQIKSIEGRRYDENVKGWFVPNTKKNLEHLKYLGFKLEGEQELSNINYELTNNYLVIHTEESTLLSLQEYFIYDNCKYCFVNGRFDKTRIKKEKFLTISENVGILPIGFKNNFSQLLFEKNVGNKLKEKRKFYDIQISDNRIKNNLDYLELRDYQIKTVKICLNEGGGIVKLPTSSGKSEIFLSLCNILKIKTLILFSTITLAHQTKRRAKKAKLDTGIVQGNNVDENHDIVMCTIQSAHKLKNKYEMVIVDECHRSQGDQYNKILSRPDFLYRFGFSATPFCKDKYKNALVQQWFGDIIYTVPAEVLIENGYIAKPLIKIITITTPNLNKNYFLKWRQVENLGIVYNDYRNNKIAEICNNSKESCMVLVKRIDHGKELEKIINNSIFLYGGTKSEYREIIIRKFEKGVKLTIIASTIFDEGISLNNIRKLIIASGGKSERKTIQRIGRGLRIKEDKDTVIAYDFRDLTHVFLERHSKERIESYEKEGFTEIEYI